MKTKNPHRLEEEFEREYKSWRDETIFSSIFNPENEHFKRIVGMGIPVVPFIIKKLNEEPTHLVWALDQIFPGLLTYKGYVSCENAIKTWTIVWEAIKGGNIDITQLNNSLKELRQKENPTQD